MDVLDVVDRLSDEVANMVVVQRVDDTVAVAATGHETEMTKQPQLVRHRRLLQPDIACELGDRAGGLSQPRKDADSARRGERLHRLRDLLGEVNVDCGKRVRFVELEMPHQHSIVYEELLMLSVLP